MGVLAFVRGLLRWAFVDVPKGLCCLLYTIYFFFKWVPNTDRTTGALL
jgi:hypothetical protein